MCKSKVKSLQDYIKKISTLIEINNVMKVMYRGQSNDKELLPKIFRNTFLNKSEMLKVEAEMLEDFKRKAIPYLNYNPPNDFEWLAIAQHHGLKTRLLDWTENALAALWFCVEKESNKSNEDGVVWVYESFFSFTDYICEDDYNLNPFEIGHTKIFKPQHSTKRIISQSGIFTIHKLFYENNKISSLEKDSDYENKLTKIRISGDKFKIIKNNLERCGINYSSLFPDLDGLCKSLNEICFSKEYIEKINYYFGIRKDEKIE